MRTKILKYFGMVVVLIIMVNLTSCEVSIESWYDDDDYSEIYYRTTRELCSRTWQETWEQDGEYYTQRLDFYENRTGTDIIQIEHRNGYVTEDRYNFEWRWDNSAQTCIRMVYGPSDISYFENIWLAGNFLKGTLDGVNVISQESGKRKSGPAAMIGSTSAAAALACADVGIGMGAEPLPAADVMLLRGRFWPMPLPRCAFSRAVDARIAPKTPAWRWFTARCCRCWPPVCFTR